MRFVQALLLATKPVNYFLPGTNVPYKNENGDLVKDPNRCEVMFVTDDGVIHTARIAKDDDMPKSGRINVVYNTIAGYNNDSEFVYAIGKA
jgi:hypothetical protein